jgi:transcriptional regulator with PAS, ATPase and Fis domain
MEFKEPNIPLESITPELINTLRVSGLHEQAAILEQRLKNNDDTFMINFITENELMLELKENARLLSKASVVNPVLIIGETGTGKELIARALHGNRKGEFLAINCAGMPENLIESELFGHIKGAFTGADKPKTGLMEAAKDGTLFLDEVGELDIKVQPKLLRALDEKKIRRVGSNEHIEINCRIVCATNRSLEDMVEKGTFREDLYWRINTFTLKTIPLRERPEDIPLIVEHLDKEKKLDAKEMSKFMEFIMCKELMERMTRGNVRALKAYMDRYYVLKEYPTPERR